MMRAKGENKLYSKSVMYARVGAAYQKYVKRFLSESAKDGSYIPEAFDCTDQAEAAEFLEGR